MSEVIYSNIAIDMGGKYTGVASYTAEDVPSPEDVHAAIIEMPNNGEGINYTVKGRTATRHRVRSQDRYVKARRLIYSVISYVCGRSLSMAEQEAISSVMLRRGYTRLESEIDTSPIEECLPDVFSTACSEFFNNEAMLIDQFTNNCEIDTIKNFRIALLSDKIKEEISKIKDKVEKKSYEKALKAMQESVNAIINQTEFGHKHRREYLTNICKDIDRDTRLTDIKNKFGGLDRIYNCIGNISNLQLRALRWYFDDPNMNKESSFNPEKFRKIWIRAYQYFHYPKSTDDEVNHKKEVNSFIENAKQVDNVIDLLCSINPLITIPPYEDQNNRRPPIDQTLLLSPLALDKQYPGKWEKWALAFMNYDNELNSLLLDGIDEIIEFTDRKNRLQSPGKNSEIMDSYTKDKLKCSYYLQRLLDLSRVKDVPITHIRKWATDENPKKCDVETVIINTIGIEERDIFYKFCNGYPKIERKGNIHASPNLKA